MLYQLELQAYDFEPAGRQGFIRENSHQDANFQRQTPPSYDFKEIPSVCYDKIISLLPDAEHAYDKSGNIFSALIAQDSVSYL